MESRSTVLGVLPDAVDPEPALEVQLEAGERVLLYTDGITDVFNSEGKMLECRRCSKICSGDGDAAAT